MPSPAATFLPSLQSLRAIAVLGVIACHLSMFGGAPPQLWVGIHGVNLFFVISGFIIAWTYDGSGSPWFYLRARCVRIYPPYWAVLLLTLGYYALRTTRAWPAPPVLEKGTDWWAIARSFLLYDQGFPVKVVEVAWTLTYEVLFYGFYLLRFVVSGRAFAAVAAAWVAMIAGGYHSQWTIAERHPVLFDPKIVEFHAGMLTAWLAARLPATRSVLWFAAATALCGVMAYATAYGLIDPLAMVRNWTLPFALLVLAGVLFDRGGTRAYPGWLLELGAASYSLYLTNYLVMDFCDGLHRERPVVLGMLAIAFGLIFYRAVERPLLRALSLHRAASPHWQDASSSVPPHSP